MSDTAYDASPAMMAARGQTYGKATQQMEAQRAVPMGRSPVETTAAQAVRPQPNTPGAFFGPTTRPDEPITAGAPFGPGPGTEVTNAMSPLQDQIAALAEIRAIYRMHPSQELLDIIQFYEDALG